MGRASILLLLALLAASSLVGGEPEVGVIEGIVRGVDGTPVQGATVTLTWRQRPSNRFDYWGSEKVTTDRAGRFRFENLPPDTYHLIAECEECCPTEDSMSGLFSLSAQEQREVHLVVEVIPYPRCVCWTPVHEIRPEVPHDAFAEVAWELRGRLVDVPDSDILGELADIRETTARMEELPKHARSCLWENIRRTAIEEAPAASNRVRTFLESHVPEIQLTAIHHLHYEDESWLENAEPRGLLIEILQDSEADLRVREFILELFKYHEAFDHVETIAVQIASSSDPEQAHMAARLVMPWPDDEEEVDGVIPFLDHPSVALREEAALWLLREYVLDGQKLQRAIGMAAATALNKSYPPTVRGDAINALGSYADHPTSLAALRRLLEPEYWFYGAFVYPFTVHSLAAVIDVLDRSDDPSVRADLLTIYDALPELRAGEREYVEWLLRLATDPDFEDDFIGPTEPLDDPEDEFHLEVPGATEAADQVFATEITWQFHPVARISSRTR